MTAILAGCSGGDDNAAHAANPAPTPSASAGSPVAPPKIRAGQWLMRTVNFEGDKADRDLLDVEPQRVCVREGTTILDAGETSLSQCAAPKVLKTASGYLVQAQCATATLKSSVKATYSGDLQTTVKGDVTIAMAPAGEPPQTLRVSIDGRYQGPCTGNED